MLVVVVHSLLLPFFIHFCSSSFVDVLHSHLLFGIHPSPFRGLSTGFYTHFIISPQPISQSDLRHFHFQSFRYLLAAGTTVLMGHFFTHGRFLSYAPPLAFYLCLAGGAGGGGGGELASSFIIQGFIRILFDSHYIIIFIFRTIHI